MPERLRLSGIWFLFFNLYRLPIPGDILLFCDATALPPEFQPLPIRAGVPFCVA